ncbi:MAG: flagellar biosynthesis anti-sigma factor FlgM [Acetivibrionales bacterium]|jgi:negative regulator of flagellin synthesis FlgM
MKIWDGVPKISEVYGKQKSVGKADKIQGVYTKKDVLSISHEAKDFQTVMKALKEIPDIRSEKVKELAERYQSGNYNVNGRDIADKIVRSIIDKKV